MSRDRRLDLLSAVELFSGCSKKELQEIAALVDLVDAKPGEVLMQEGKPGMELFVIAAGAAKVTARGKEIATLYPGDVFGEMALLERGPRAATVTAQTPMSLYVVGPAEFSSLLEEVPQIGRKMLKVLASRLRQVQTNPIF